MAENNKALVLFDEKIRLGGDVIYLARAALNTKSAVYVEENKYHYYQRNISGCHTINLDKRMDWIKSYFIVIDMFEKNNISEEIISYVKRFLAYHTSNVAELACKQKDSGILKQCQNIMRRYEHEYISLNKEYPERIKRYKELEMKEMV